MGIRSFMSKRILMWKQKTDVEKARIIGNLAICCSLASLIVHPVLTVMIGSGLHANPFGMSVLATITLGFCNVVPILALLSLGIWSIASGIRTKLWVGMAKGILSLLVLLMTIIVSFYAQYMMLFYV